MIKKNIFNITTLVFTLCFLNLNCFAKDIIEDLKTSMRYNNEKQQVIASNIARANIPHEKAMTLPDLKLDEDSNSYRKLQLANTSQKHIRNKNSSDNHFKTMKSKDNLETTINGNNINLVEQTELMRQVAMDNKVAVEMYKRFGSIMKTAISTK